MDEEIRIGSFTISPKAPGRDAPDPERELRKAVESALKEYEPGPGESVPSLEDFELREEQPFGAETLLVVFLTAAATAAGKKFGDKTVDAIWELVAERLRDSRKARIAIRDDDPT